MMQFIRERLLAIAYPYNPIDARRARLLVILSAAGMAGTALWMVFILLPFNGLSDALRLNSLLASVVIFAPGVMVVRLTQTGSLRAARWLFVITLVVIVMVYLFLGTSAPSLNDTSTLALAVPVVAAGVLLQRRSTLVIGVLMALIVGLLALSQFQITLPIAYIPARRALSDFLVTLLMLSLVTIFLIASMGSIERLANRALMDATRREWITAFGAELAMIEDENALLARALIRIRERLGYLYVQVALNDELGILTRILRTEMGQQDAALRPLARLPETNILVEAARKQKAFVTTATEPSNRRGHLMNATLSAAAIPLVFNGQTLGVLDMQSSNPNAFGDDELGLLGLLADQVAVALHHERLQAISRRTLHDRDATVARLEAQLQEYRQRERRGVSSTWGNYVQGRGKQAIGFDLDTRADQLLPAEDLPADIRRTLQAGNLHVEMHGDEQMVHVPIQFRGYTLGAMAFTLPPEQPLTERELEMAQIVSERLALALENTRLFEQSQAQAVRERKASEITGLLIGATDVRAVLNLAADTFREALGAVHTRILIQPDVLVEPLAPLSGGSGNGAANASSNGNGNNNANNNGNGNGKEDSR